MPTTTICLPEELKARVARLKKRAGITTHALRYKYRLYYGVPGECRVRYDNERGKGDHRHFGGQEGRYSFSSMEQLLDDFRSDVERWR